MSEADLSTEVRRWLRYAQEDLVTAEHLANQQPMIPRQVCFLTQQAAEKALKAVLIFAGIDYPWRHDLEALRLLIPDGWQIKNEPLNLAALTEWAVEARYPGAWPEATEVDAREAAAQARAVVGAVLRDLRQHGFDTGEIQ